MEELLLFLRGFSINDNYLIYPVKYMSSEGSIGVISLSKQLDKMLDDELIIQEILNKISINNKNIIIN